jgi:hypothetical protein
VLESGSYRRGQGKCRQIAQDLGLRAQGMTMPRRRRSAVPGEELKQIRREPVQAQMQAPDQILERRVGEQSHPGSSIRQPSGRSPRIVRRSSGMSSRAPGMPRSKPASDVVE